MNALEVITDAYSWLNRLSPGETLNADDAARGFTRLNLLVDKLSAKNAFLYQSVQTSSAQTGNITLGTGAWASIPAGTLIDAVSSNGAPVSPISMAQYQAIFDTTTTGSPMVYAQDGLANVFFVPVPNGQTLKVLARFGVSEFADQTTQYTVPQGYKAMLGIALAVSLAPAVLGKIPPELLREQKSAMDAIGNYIPAIVDAVGYCNSKPVGNILSGFV